MSWTKGEKKETGLQNLVSSKEGHQKWGRFSDALLFISSSLATRSETSANVTWKEQSVDRVHPVL